jgi:hypothetical protein
MAYCRNQAKKAIHCRAQLKYSKIEGFKEDRREYQRLYRKAQTGSQIIAKQNQIVTDVSSNELKIDVNPYINLGFEQCVCIVCKKIKFYEG